MARALVTGATGFVGANLTRRLLADGHDVHLLVRPGHRTWRLADIIDTATVHEADLTRGEDVRGVVRAAGPDWVFHLAAHGAYPWEVDHEAMMATNVVGATVLVDACLEAGVASFVNVGTSSEYGPRDHAPDEAEAAAPDTFYGLTKAWVTMLARFSGLRTVRLYSVYGPWEDERRLVPQLILHGLRGEYPRLAAADAAHDFVYVDDAVEALILAARMPAEGPGRVSSEGPVFNVGTGVQTTLRDAVDVARRVLEVEAEPVWDTMAARPWDTTTWVADRTLATESLGWHPRFSFEHGFRESVAWFRSRPDLDPGPLDTERRPVEP